MLNFFTFVPHDHTGVMGVCRFWQGPWRCSQGSFSVANSSASTCVLAPSQLIWMPQLLARIDMTPKRGHISVHELDTLLSLVIGTSSAAGSTSADVCHREVTSGR
jgi:hypothetical protein